MSDIWSDSWSNPAWNEAKQLEFNIIVSLDDYKLVGHILEYAMQLGQGILDNKNCWIYLKMVDELFERLNERKSNGEMAVDSSNS